jgi:hypothetical protein
MKAVKNYFGVGVDNRFFSANLNVKSCCVKDLNPFNALVNKQRAHNNLLKFFGIIS